VRSPGVSSTGYVHVYRRSRAIAPNNSLTLDVAFLPDVVATGASELTPRPAADADRLG
jgi:hypothetical protein